VQFGQVFTHGDNGSPITQRLYLGGPNSHRGFTFNRLSYQVCSALANEQAPVPTKVDCSTDPNIGGSSTLDFRRLPIGGDQMLLGQFEVRVNLFKLFGQWLSFASFMDAGDVAAPSSGNCTGPSCQDIPYLSAIDLRRLHVAVGGGLRYRTVIGAIRFDLGVRLNRVDFQEADGVQNPDPGQRIAYHISIGEAF
jgi:outer membrane protein assembly factor BamA